MHYNINYILYINQDLDIPYKLPYYSHARLRLKHHNTKFNWPNPLASNKDRQMCIAMSKTPVGCALEVLPKWTDEKIERAVTQDALPPYVRQYLTQWHDTCNRKGIPVRLAFEIVYDGAHRGPGHWVTGKFMRVWRLE